MNRVVDLTSPQPANEHRAIFAVDDDANDRLLFQRAVAAAQLPHPCRIFAAGDQLLDALIDVLRGAPLPLACFVDVKMAGMSGLDVLRWIRVQHTLDAMAVVMLSSSDCAQYLVEAQQFGAQCYALKFPEPPEMRKIVAAAEHYAAAAHCGAPFTVASNLLLGVGVS